MKIGFFMVPQLTSGAGAGKYFIETAKNLRQRYGVETNIITLDKEFFKIFGKFVCFYYGRAGREFRNKTGGLGETRKSVRPMLGKVKWVEVSLKTLKEELQKYEVIYSKNEIVELVILRILGYKNLPPIVVGVHTPLEYPYVTKFQEKLHNWLYLGFFYKWLLKGISTIHLSNMYTRDLVEKTFKVNSEFIYYPFSVEEFRKGIVPDSKLKGLEFSEDQVHAGYTGRLTEQKGISSLINIVNQISLEPRTSKKVQIHIFGSSGLDLLVEELANKHEFLEFHGYVKHELIPAILSKLDFYITAAKWETFPYNVVEAQAMGLPVIAFNIPGTNEIVIDGKTGYLVKDEQEFVRRICELIENPNIFDPEEISKSVKRRFNPDKIYKQLYDMFTRQVKGSP